VFTVNKDDMIGWFWRKQCC